jgi:hypothetical protein
LTITSYCTWGQLEDKENNIPELINASDSAYVLSAWGGVDKLHVKGKYIVEGSGALARKHNAGTCRPRWEDLQCVSILWQQEWLP